MDELMGYVKEDSVCLLKYQACIWNTSFWRTG